uniref:Inter-alpha-trypsin inhibitor heavy chain H3 n=1 Tax=Tetraodon nigroviridis TaxID=99883 RepID=H3D0L7_TETNG
MVEVYSVMVDCTVASRFARTVMTSKAWNKANARQISFEVQLPKTAFISNFSMEINGRVYVGEVKEKEKAKQQYEKATSAGKTAGLVKAAGRKMEKFSVSVNIAANSTVAFVLTYEELLQRKMGQYEILTQVTPELPVQEFQIVADIYEAQGLAFVEASATFLTNELLPLVKKTVTDTRAHVSFSPTLEQQRKCPGCEGTIINGDFIIKYGVKQEQSLGEVQIVNGYFVHFFAPPHLPRVPKNVVFVIDRSGSMNGMKMQQTRDALQAILKDLHEEDHFALVVFDSTVSQWRNSLTKATKKNVSQAINYVKTIKDRGATALHEALMTGKMLRKEREEAKLPERSADMIITLTDGMPNHGVSDIKVIQKDVQSAIGGNMSLFCLGFGNDVDYSFLDVMSRQNKGLARRIFTGSDATLQLQGFYDEVSSPLLLDVDLRYPENTVDLLTKTQYSQLFNGSEIVVSGQLTNNDPENFLVEVFAKGAEHDFQVRGKARVLDTDVIYPEKDYIFGDFSERLWAYLTIQQLLENRFPTQFVNRHHSEKDRNSAKALEMSLRYGFVTPLTSMVVTKPESDRSSPLLADKLTERAEQADINYSVNYSQKVQRPRGPPFLVDGDPHFMIEPDRGDSLCFNINGNPGTIFNLVTDAKSGFIVNGEIVGKKKDAPGGNSNNYIGRLGISHKKLGVRLDVSTQDISVFHDGKHIKLLWSDTASVKSTNLDLRLVKNCSLTVTLKHAVKFEVIKHSKVWKRQHKHQEYLGFYTLDSHHLSASVHGLLGQFYRGIEFEVTESLQSPDAIMYVKGQTLNVTRHWQKDFSQQVIDGKVMPCWFVNNNGTGLIDGKPLDYIVSGLF